MSQEQTNTQLLDKKYDYHHHETTMRDFWQEQRIYQAHIDHKRIFTIDTPPPTVSGSLHIGHVFSYTQTDIIARYKRLLGFNVIYPMGFDDNGLATERFVEKKHGISPRELGREAFIQLCLKETKETAQHFKSIWQDIGLSVDWSLTYSTIAPQTQRIAQASFIDLYNKNYIYRKQEPALYCTTCLTTVAQAELDDIEKPASFNTLVFNVSNSNQELLISTTRPELLASCVAVFYHPSDARYAHLHKQEAITPLYHKKVPILADELVDPDKGTGLVMCCTFGDKTDILWYKKHKLAYIQSIDRYGKWTDITGPLAGMRCATARKTILELLAKAHALKAQTNISHAVNVHERCKKEIEYLVLPQWFLSVLPHKQQLIEQAKKITWYPDFMISRYNNWVENIGWDWCLSRQRFYGIPFPVWYCRSCQATLMPTLDELPVDPLQTSYNKACPHCHSSDIQPDADVMDTWNTSSLTPYIVAQLLQPETPIDFSHPAPFVPMSMRPQAHDIIRTWAFYTIVKTQLHSNVIPWQDIVISGHVLSKSKEKLSKSRGNSALTPENLLATYPSDAIRYWTASAHLGYDLAFSENQLAIGHKLLIKLWNAFRFMQSHLINFTPQQPPKQFGDINAWLLDNISRCFERYQAAFKKYEFSISLQHIESFFWHIFCDSYLELIKDQFSTDSQYSAEQINETQWTLFHVGLRILQLYSPFVPHITEILYQKLYKNYVKKASIHQTEFKNIQTVYNYPESIKVLEYIQAVVHEVRKLKTEEQLSLKTPVHSLTIAANSTIQCLLKTHTQLLKGITRTNKLLFTEEPQATKIQVQVIPEQNSLYHIIVNLNQVIKAEQHDNR